MSEKYRVKVKAVLLYLECGHTCLAHGYKGQKTLRCFQCDPVALAAIIKHGATLERDLRKRRPAGYRKLMKNGTRGSRMSFSEMA